MVFSIVIIIERIRMPHYRLDRHTYGQRAMKWTKTKATNKVCMCFLADEEVSL